MGLDQAVLDATHAVWNEERAALNQGQMSVRPLAGRPGMLRPSCRCGRATP
jgi:hypothetical protein